MKAGGQLKTAPSMRSRLRPKQLLRLPCVPSCVLLVVVVAELHDLLVTEPRNESVVPRQLDPAPLSDHDHAKEHEHGVIADPGSPLAPRCAGFPRRRSSDLARPDGSRYRWIRRCRDRRSRHHPGEVPPPPLRSRRSPWRPSSAASPPRSPPTSALSVSPPEPPLFHARQDCCFSSTAAAFRRKAERRLALVLDRSRRGHVVGRRR